MSLTALLSKPCTLVRRTLSGETDRFNNAKHTETLVETVCELQQISRDEPGDAGELSITRWHLFLPYGTDVNTGDTAIVGDQEYEVVGDPWDATTGSAAMWHVEATVVRTRGADDEAGS